MECAFCEVLIVGHESGEVTAAAGRSGKCDGVESGMGREGSLGPQKSGTSPEAGGTYSDRRMRAATRAWRHVHPSIDD
jgi:butyrate kinase